jgi:hypothetical protein
MTSRNFKHFAASQGAAAMVLASMLFLGSGPTARAQSNGDNSQRGLEGAWRLQVTVRDCITGQPLRPTFPALATFAKGGTATIVTGGQPPSLFTPQLGVWRHTHGQNYTAVGDAFVFSAAGVWIQTHRFTRAIQVSADGASFIDQIALQILDTADNPIATGGCGTTVATRFE